MPIDRTGTAPDAAQVLRPATRLEEAHADALRVTRGLRAAWPHAPNFLELEGEFLHYVDEGPRDAPVLLCVHGNPTWGFLWREVLREFSGSYRVVVPDHMGMGLSSRPHRWNYRLESHQAALGALIDHLDLQDVTLMVHDWGGPIGLGAAIQRSDRIRRLVITNSAGWTEGPMPLGLRVGKLPVVGHVAIRMMSLMHGLVPTLCTERGLADEVARGFAAPYGTYGDRAAMHAFVRDIPLSPRHPSYAALDRVDAALPAFADRPTLILWGLQDWVFTPTFLRGWRERFPRAEVHAFEEAGHLVLEDARGPCIDRLRAFLRAADEEAAA